MITASITVHRNACLQNTQVGIDLDIDPSEDPNDAGFHVERQVDGEAFASIRFVDGAGTTDRRPTDDLLGDGGAVGRAMESPETVQHARSAGACTACGCQPMTLSGEAGAHTDSASKTLS